MRFEPDHFDKLRKQARALSERPIRPTDSSILTVELFLNVINSMEKIHNQIVSTEIDLTKHDEHGRVADA